MRQFRHWFGSLLMSGMVLCLGACHQEAAPLPESDTSASNPTSRDDDASSESEFVMGVQSEPAGTAPNGRDVERYILSNQHGMKVTVMTYGAIVTSVDVPDRDGTFDNVTLGFSSFDQYLQNAPYFGAICGRYANRIAGARFELDGEEYQLTANEQAASGVNQLHGGLKGFDKVVWTAEPIHEDDEVGVSLTYVSADGEEGYPGNLTTTVRYLLNNDNELKIEYTAVADKATPVNLTNHCYWNLRGRGDVLAHRLQLNCDRYLPVDENMIPVGELADVQGTPMDFTEPKAIGSRLEETGNGYDHCYVIREGGEPLQLAARVEEPESGRVMEVWTTEPGIQLYTGNFLDGSKEVGGFGQHEGFCLECQHYPDSPNQSQFPNTILQPGDVYTQTTMHRFSVDSR